METRSFPSKRAVPVTVAPLGSSPIRASTDTVFPLPLSPAIPKTRPSPTSYETPSTICSGAVVGRDADAQLLDVEKRHATPWCLLRDTPRGSSRSRRLSPRKLNAITAVKIARPGKVPIHQYWKYCVPTETIEPHSGSGG